MWSLTDGFNVNQLKNFNAWANQQQQEIINGNIVGVNINPGFAPGDPLITEAKELSSFIKTKASIPTLLNGGIDIQQLFGIQKGSIDFNGNAAPMKGIGASF
ncbi:MAG: hypothetical protein WDN26_12325 [Chitinophagaceae bacterium]